MQSKITDRVAAQTGIPRLLQVLAEEISPSDLQSLLLAVFQIRGRAISEPHILAHAERSSLAAPSRVDARLLNAFDQIAFATAGAFDAVDLSPVEPLGTSAALGGIDPNNVLTSIRNMEVLGDCTSAMAIECACRRRRNRQDAVRVCSSHRVIRLQPFDTPGFTPHFRLFGLVSAGRDTGSHAFEIQHLTEHIRYYLELFRALNQAAFQLTAPLVEISDLTVTESILASAGISRDQVRESVRAHIQGGSARFLAEHGVTLPRETSDARLDLIRERVFTPLKADFPEAELAFNLARLEGLGYYTGLCLRISPTAPDGVRYPIIDGGFTDWTARLLQDRKERLLTSGMGTEFACRRYLTAGLLRRSRLGN